MMGVVDSNSAEIRVGYGEVTLQEASLGWALQRLELTQ